MWSVLMRLAAAVLAFLAAMAVTRFGPAALGRASRLIVEIGVWGAVLLLLALVVWLVLPRRPAPRR